MHIHPHINMHRLFKTKKELEEIYLNQIIQKFALTLVGIFIPIYLVSVGFGVGNALLFMLVYFIFLGAAAPINAFISSRIGLKHIILYRTPVLITFFVLLMLINPQLNGLEMGLLRILLIPISAMGGFSQGLYWVSINAEFVKNCDRIHSGEEVSHLIALPKLVSMVAPIIAALFLEAAGFTILFAIVIVLMFFSVIPLFLSADYKRYFSFNFSKFRLFLSRHLFVRLFSEGTIHTVEAIIWPLFIYLRFQDIVSVGIAATLTGLGIVIFTLIVGKLSDRIDRLMLLRLGGLTYGILCFMRFFSTSITEIYLLSFLGGIFYTLITVNLFANFCDYSKGKNILAGVSFRELWLGVGRIVLLFAVIMFLPSIEIAFIIAGIMSLVHLAF
jgi:MFS family permease